MHRYARHIFDCPSTAVNEHRNILFGVISALEKCSFWLLVHK
jgi:hypothetical protein